MPSSKLPPRSRQWLAILATAVLAPDGHGYAWPRLRLVAAAPDALPLARGDIAFESMRDGNAEIYVMNADGSGQTRLTNNPAVDRDPAWSPDGRQIVFASTRDDSLVGNVEIYVMNADGSGQTRLTNNPAGDLVPAWSPNGRQIAFDSYRDGNIEIYVMNVDGSGQTRLTNNPAAETGSAWSPDGTQIAFVSGRDLNDEIYVMNADGGGQTRLTNNTTQDFDPAWSPDGTQIAFESLRDGNAEIYVMNADGSGQARLTNNLTADLHPAWSPDGTQIAFVSNRDGNFEIYVMNADGGGQARLTNNPAQDGKPSWGFAKADAKADAGFALGREWAIPGDLRNTRSFFATFNAGSSVDLLDILFKPAWYSRFGDPKAFGQSPLSLNTPLAWIRPFHRRHERAVGPGWQYHRRLLRVHQLAEPRHRQRGVAPLGPSRGRSRTGTSECRRHRADGPQRLGWPVLQGLHPKRRCQHLSRSQRRGLPAGQRYAGLFEAVG
ncbi:MAG: PD40 domain-containing protein [Ardenticatenia bacterium]|nr:PD40 domain-containing protein [Ardenticatenia bacterium]